MATVRTAATGELRADEVRILRELFDAAWEREPEDFEDEDWEHAVGGLHFVLEDDGAIAAHASVVERDSIPEATSSSPATSRRSPPTRRTGDGATAPRSCARSSPYIDRTFQLGALGGDPAFYVPRGWSVWEGPTFVRTEAGLVRTPEEDGTVLIRRTPTTPPIHLAAPISCAWRPGDVW